MDSITQFSEFFSSTEFAVPASQVVIFAAITSLSLFLGRYKLGLLVSYSFVFYWGYIFNRVHFVDSLGQSSAGLYVYGLLGIGMLVMAVIGFLRGD